MDNYSVVYLPDFWCVLLLVLKSLGNLILLVKDSFAQGKQWVHHTVQDFAVARSGHGADFRKKDSTG